MHSSNPTDAPVLLIALTSDTLPLTKVDDYAESILAQKISQMPGVALVGIGGQQKPAIRVQLNPVILAAQGLDLDKFAQLSELSDVATDQATTGRQLNLEINRDTAARMGIDSAAVDNTLYDAFGQRHVAQIFTTLNYYYVIMEVERQFSVTLSFPCHGHARRPGDPGDDTMSGVRRLGCSMMHRSPNVRFSRSLPGTVVQ